MLKSILLISLFSLFLCQMTKGEKIAQCVKSQVGKIYQYRGRGPDTFDNLGLIKYCHEQEGINIYLPHWTDRDLLSLVRANGTQVDKVEQGVIVFGIGSRDVSCFLALNDKFEYLGGYNGCTLSIKRHTGFSGLGYDYSYAYYKLW